MDIVFLRGLRIETTIGIYDWEKAIKQPVILDLEMASDVARGASSDRIADALDYKAVSKRIKQFVADSRFELVETLAERCAAIIRDEIKLTAAAKVHADASVDAASASVIAFRQEMATRRFGNLAIRQIGLWPFLFSGLPTRPVAALPSCRIAGPQSPVPERASTMTGYPNRIIFPLDVPTLTEAVSLARRLAPYLAAVKIGNQLFTAEGPEAVRAMHDLGLRVFLWNLIPNRPGVLFPPARFLRAG
jgi:dihydroneopterin aldolase